MIDRLVCRMCVLHYRDQNIVVPLANLPRYASTDELREHWNSEHRLFGNKTWSGLERCWIGITDCGRLLDQGFMLSCGDAGCTYFELWCVNCDHKTTDPLAVVNIKCPNCGRAAIGQNVS